MTGLARYYIPVCLYPHTKYRTKAGITDLFKKYSLRTCEHLIVITDRLLVLDRFVTGRYWSPESAFIAARREADQIRNLIDRISHKSGAAAKGRVVFWDHISGADDFERFAMRLRKEIEADTVLTAAIEQFVTKRVERFGLGAAPDRERGHEREYIVSEICMSVYCTEVLQYWTEVWERPPARDVPDPLKLLYEVRSELVARVTGHANLRVLDFLYAAQ